MLIIFGTHNLQTFKHNTLTNKVLLLQFYLFNIRLKLAASPEVTKIMHHTVPNILNFTSSLLMLLFVQHVSGNSYKLPGALKFTIIQTLDQDFVFFTEWCHVDRQCEA